MIATQHLHEQPPSLSRLKPSIPPAVDAVVRKALAKEPDARYNSAREMAQALREAINPSSNIIAKETTYTAHTPPPTYNPPQSAYNSPYETAPAEYSTQREPYAYAAGSAPSPYPDNAFYGSGMDEHAILPASSSQTNVGNPRWPIWIISLCVVIILIAGGLLLGLPTLKSLVGISGSSSPATATTSTSPSTASTPSSQGQAQRVVQSYYDAINRADYQSAYQLWGTSYQSSHPYDQFAKGFATTVHDTITIKSTTQQADGTYSVAITLVATDKTSTGTTTTTYTGNYTIGLENGTMKLLTAYFQQVS
jgi:serine/threonine protein kinase